MASAYWASIAFGVDGVIGHTAGVECVIAFAVASEGAAGQVRSVGLDVRAAEVDRFVAVHWFEAYRAGLYFATFVYASILLPLAMLVEELGCCYSAVLCDAKDILGDVGHICRWTMVRSE